MNKNIEKYAEYFYLRVNEYNIKDWHVYLQIERTQSVQPSRLVIDENNHVAYLLLNEMVIDNQWEDIVIDKPLRTLCCLLYEIETPRLVIRHFKESDYQDYAELVTQSNMRIWEGNRILHEESEIMDYFHKDIHDPFKFALCEKKEQKVIGHISIHPSSSRSVPSHSMGYGLSQAYHKKGYMTEAALEMLKFCFETLHAELVEASYFEGNENSANVIRKLGMRYEGFKKYGYWDPNRGPMDIHVNSITKEEYERNSFQKFSEKKY